MATSDGDPENPLDDIPDDDLETAATVIQRLVDAGEIDPDSPTGRLSRRDLLAGAGALGAGALLGGGASTQLVDTAAAGSQQSGTKGTASNPLDLYAEDIWPPGGSGSGNSTFIESVDTDEVGITDPTLVYVWGEGSNLLTTRDPADFTDVFAAVNDVFASVSDSEQVTIWLPYTGSAGVDVSTSLTIPTGQTHPNLVGHGENASVFNYTPTDGSHALTNNSSVNNTGYTWRGFALVGPGSGTASGDGINTGGSNNHTVELAHLKATDFGGAGIKYAGGLFTGSIHHCAANNNGAEGVYANRLNGGGVHHCIAQGNGGAQVYLDGCYAGAVYSNDIDAGAGGTAPAGSIGLHVENASNRAGPFVFWNYMESNETHVTLQNGGVPVRGASVAYNRMHQGSTGVHVVNNVNRSFVTYNLFEGIGSEDILLDGTGMVLGPNAHVNSTTKLADNTAGGFDAVSQSSGTYPW